MSGDRTQEKTEGPVQDIRPAAEEDQTVRAIRKPIAEEVASGLEAETGSTQESSSAGPEAEVAGGGEIVCEEGCAKGEREEGVTAVW